MNLGVEEEGELGDFTKGSHTQLKSYQEYFHRLRRMWKKHEFPA